MTGDDFLRELALVIEEPVAALDAQVPLAQFHRWDSTAAIHVIALLEGAFGVEVHHERVAACTTVADLIALAEGKLG